MSRLRSLLLLLLSASAVAAAAFPATPASLPESGSDRHPGPQYVQPTAASRSNSRERIRRTDGRVHGATAVVLPDQRLTNDSVDSAVDTFARPKETTPTVVTRRRSLKSTKSTSQSIPHTEGADPVDLIEQVRLQNNQRSSPSDSYDPGQEPNFDCERYGSHLIDECREQTPGDGTDGAQTTEQPTVPPGNDGTVVDGGIGPPIRLPPNHVSVRVSIALSHGPDIVVGDRLRFFHRIIDEATTKMLDKETPFRAKMDEERSRRRYLRVLEPSSSEDLSPASGQMAELRHLVSTVDPGPSIAGLERVDKEARDTVYHWYSIEVFYTTHWMSGDALKNKDYLDHVHAVCQSVVDYRTKYNDYRNRLRKQEDHHRRQNNDGFLLSDDDEDRISIMATSRPGQEDETVRIITDNIMHTSTSTSDSSDNFKIDSVSSFDSEEFRGRIFERHIRLDEPWSSREWFGLGVFAFIATVGVLLPATANTLRMRQRRRLEWGQTPFLTEDGVNDVLNIGWRYTHGEEDGNVSSDTQQSSTPNQSRNSNSDGARLFLQVFEKGRVGYTEDSSVLKGGLHVVHAAVNTSHETTIPTAVSSNNSLSQTLSADSKQHPERQRSHDNDR